MFPFTSIHASYLGSEQRQTAEALTSEPAQPATALAAVGLDLSSTSAI